MKLRFIYPDTFDSLEIMLTTKAYENIWLEDGEKIIERFAFYTGLQFQQDEIEVLVYNGQSMSGKDGVPMRLSSHNDTLIKKRNALVHELAHRLLFGNGLYAPENTVTNDNDEIRVFLFQGDVIQDIYGEEDYSQWASLDRNEHVDDYLRDMRFVLSLSKTEREHALRTIIRG